MKNVDEMSLEQKLMELQQCLSKAKVGAENPGSTDYEFLLNSKLGDQRDEKLAYYTTVLTNSKQLIGGRLNQLDYDVRQNAIRDINNKLNDALLAFPGYGKTEELNQSQGLGR
jgi:hypothetical protein